jgi:hypothetical protein
MLENPIIEELKRSRNDLADQLETLSDGKIQMGSPEDHAARLHWLRDQIDRLDFAIEKSANSQRSRAIAD